MATASRITFKGTLKVHCSYYMHEECLQNTLKGTTTCSIHISTALHETYIASWRNLDVYMLKLETHIIHVQETAKILKQMIITIKRDVFCVNVNHLHTFPGKTDMEHNFSFHQK